MDEKKITELENRFESCKESIHTRLSSLENSHIIKLIKLETQMETTLNVLKEFVTHAQFTPVRLIAYGLAGGVLLTVLAAVLVKVIV